jgi:hypothetical protein
MQVVSMPGLALGKPVTYHCEQLKEVARARVVYMRNVSGTARGLVFTANIVMKELGCLVLIWVLI